jgi:radical SAM superfamily enzyme YgiQ (UPF0313 family)
MSNNELVSISSNRRRSSPPPAGGKILLVKPPYFTPWTPPLGIAILKTYMEQHGYSVTCYDFNIDPELWGMHHKYFTTLQTLEDVSINDGYSKLWWILNAHMLACANGADAATCARVLDSITPLYGIHCNREVIDALISLVEKFFKRLGDLIDELNLSDFSTVGTSTYTTSLAPSLFFLKTVKQKYPRITTVMGGGVFADDLALGSDNLTTLIEEYPYVDYAVLGEGELLFLKLMQGELSHKRVISLADLKGDTLGMKDVPIPDFTNLNINDYWHLTIEGARSCPFQCSFCSETIQWGEYRKKPMDLFTQQVIDLSEKYNNNAFFMGDSLMNPYIAQFASALLERKANIVYDGYLRADKPVTHRDRLEVWARSGLYRVRLGIESASARVLDSMDKMTSPQVIADALKALANSGIRTTTYWIVGFQGETEEDFQETCDFIREHHRYIYELEAHPYYYYPYGQVGSRLHQCHSLYPDDVTDVIKFRVWDIDSSQPTRDERYERLRRISSLASELGLPNIYTMADRYVAEDRWHLLHPQAAEVYEGTRVQRKEIVLQDRPVMAFAQGSDRQLPDGESPADSVISYQVSVKKKMDETRLAASLDHLIRFNEMLQVRLENGQYLPGASAADAGVRERKTLFVYPKEEDGADEGSTNRRQIVDELAVAMRPAPGSSIRLALINRSNDSSDLLLLVHRAIADGRSVILLFEDLFRIYEQLSHEKEISLRPVQKGYLDFLDEPTTVNSSDGDPRPAQESNGEKPRDLSEESDESETEDQRVESVVVSLEHTVAKRLSSKTLDEYGTTPLEVVVTALLKTLSGRAEELCVDLAVDHRAIETGLEHTVGALTHIFRVPSELVRNAPDARQLWQVLTSLRVPELHQSRSDSDAAQKLKKKTRVLLNLEYFTDEPWLGGDEWSPEGFVVEEQRLGKTYGLEIAPLLLKSGVEFSLKYRDEDGFGGDVKSLTVRFLEELHALLDECDRYVAAKEFWLNEFRREAPISNIEIESDGPVATDEAWASSPFEIERAVLERLRLKFNVDISHVMLAAYSLLLSRLNGREDVVIVASLGDGEETPVVPLRLYPSWELSFAEFLQRVERKIPLTFMHGPDAFGILTDELPKSKQDGSSPVFDVGYVYREANPNGEVIAALNDLPALGPAGSRKLKLILEVVGSGENLSLRFNFMRNRLEEATVEKLGTYFNSILEEISRATHIPLGDIALDGHLKSSDAVDVLSKDVFNF